MSTFSYTTQPAVRAQFWAYRAAHNLSGRVPGKTQNDYPADVRQSFVEYVDYLANCGAISEALAARVTL